MRPRASAKSGGGARRKPSRATPRRVSARHAPLIVAITIIAVCWAMYEPLKVQYQASRTYHGLEREYDRLSERNETMQAEVADLKKPEGVQRLARENLGLTLPGENVYIVMPSEAATGQVSSGMADTRSANDPLTVLLDAVFGVGG